MHSNTEVWCWGAGYGFTPAQLGLPAFNGTTDAIDAIAAMSNDVVVLAHIGSTKSVYSSSGSILYSDNSINRIAVGSNHVCVQIGTKQVRCWGSNDGSALGYNPTNIGAIQTPAQDWGDLADGETNVTVW
jgi:hypothetical protein